MQTSSLSRRAPLIVIEGLDRSGKTTQTTALHTRLCAAGVKAKLLKFPDRTTPIGALIDSYLRSESDLDDHAIHLLFSANRWELASTITQALSDNTPVVCDRYTFSGIAFSAANSGLSYAWCRAPDAGLPAPDLTIFLDISPEAAHARAGYGEERYEREEMQRQVREVFGKIGEEIRGGRWIVIDAGRDQQVVEDDIWKLVESLISGVDGPVQTLWSDLHD